jgi:hypothetical protein
MEWRKYILLFEDFVPDLVTEDVDKKIDDLKNKQKTYKERIDMANRKSQESVEKANRFKQKSANTKDTTSKQIYQNRAQEEMISQKTNVAKVQALQMAQKRNEIELKTAELKKEKQGKKNL